MDRRRITQAVQQAVEPKIASELAALQQGIYSDILAGGSSLTTGTSDATNIQAAAQRLQGAGALLDGYVAQGLPQALGSDDNVRSLVSGINNDAFASTDPQINIWGVQPAAAVPEQIVNFYKTAKAVMPGFDPAELLTDDIYLRAYPVSAAILGHIVPPTTAQASA